MTVANPDLVIVSVYRPGARLRNVKCPSVLVVSACVKFVSRFFASTEAPGTLPPFSSRTSPCTVPEVICACPQAVEARHIPSATTKQAHSNFFIFLSLRLHTPFSSSLGDSLRREAACENTCRKRV